MDQHSPAVDAWHRLLDALRAATDVITGPIGAVDERERAEGVRHLTRLVSVATRCWWRRAMSTARPSPGGCGVPQGLRRQPADRSTTRR